MFKRVENQDIIEEKLSDGTTKRYVKGRLLGKGGFAKCYEFTSLQTEKKYAAKVIEKASLQKSKAKEKLTSQIKIHKSLCHEYVVRFEHFFEDAEYVYILLQKCPNQTLNELLKRRKRLTDIEAKYYLRQLALAVQYIQSEKVIHRDLKLGNLFLSEKLQIKIGDFGLATKVAYEGERKKTKCGTPNYIAPQILDDKKSHSYEVDVWSIGVIAYTLLIGKPPFETSDIKMTYNRIKTCSYSFPDPTSISQLAKDFISKMLQLDPCKRPTLAQILDDPFLSIDSTPTSLPLSCLACPPSSDFLKKFKDCEKDQSRAAQKNEPDSNSKNVFYSTVNLGGEDKKNSRMGMNKENSLKNLQNKSRMQSMQKGLTPSNRVFSTANLQVKPRTPANRNLSRQESEQAKKSVKIWVTYFEQNPKFGIGYLLNSNACGFHYNDSTAMVTNSKMNLLKYLEYDSKLRKLRDKDAKIYTPDEAEVEQYKKFKILHHFQKELKKAKSDAEAKMSNEARIKIETLKFRESSEDQMKCYVVRYHRTSNSTIFWLSNSTVQIIFQDFSELLLNQVGIMTYVNKYGERSYFQQKDKDKQGEEIKKRIKHFYSVIKGRLLKKPFEDENQNLAKSNCRNDPQLKTSLSRCPSSSNRLTASRAKEQVMRMKMKSSNSSSRLELGKKGETGRK